MNNPSDSRLNSDFVAILVLFLTALLFRLIRLFDLDLNFDEVILLYQAKHSFAGIWEVCKLDNNPPLYPWLIKLWTSFSGSDEWYRLFGALLGSLTPPAVYLLGKDVIDRRFGWLVGSASVIAGGLIFYSQFVRMFNIQPFFAVTSLLFFFRALKTDAWKFWFLTSLVNLLGFYVYLFMPFILAAEGIILLIHYRLEFKRYLRPLIAHLPYFLGVLLWAIPLINRASAVQESFWTNPHDWKDYIRIWYFYGTGTDFRNNFSLSTILNLPIFFGFMLTLFKIKTNRSLRYLLVTFLVNILIVNTISMLGQNFFHERYLLYLQPIYLCLALAGYYYLKTGWLKKTSIGLVLLIMAGSLIYYYVDYFYAHRYYGFVRNYPYAESGEGHNLSKADQVIAQHIGPNEVIIHYSNPYFRVSSYYASRYYHNFALPEYIYSKVTIPAYNGSQYLEPGDQLRNLTDLDPLPKGIWLLTLNDADAFFNEKVLAGYLRPDWVHKENLISEMNSAGYKLNDRLQFGKVTVLHYRKTNDMPDLSSSPSTTQ